MKNFVICCSQGMSSSALMKKMKDYVAQENLDINIVASTTDRVKSGVLPFDILLLGPQIRFEKSNLVKQFPDKPIDVIPMTCYGRIDGESVVKFGLELLKK